MSPGETSGSTRSRSKYPFHGFVVTEAGSSHWLASDRRILTNVFPICVLEALLPYERAGGRTPQLTAARLRGQEYLLERSLLRRKSTGELIEHDRKSGAR